MNGRPKGRQGDLIARKEWTARLNRFASAKTTKQRQAAIEGALKINPGGTVRDMLQAWGYSASARGRKAKQTAEQSATPARERLELALATLFGKKPSPVPSLYAKLAGRVDTTVRDACRIVAALIFAWPEPLGGSLSAKTKEGREAACSLAELFIRELLGELSAGRSREWTGAELKSRTFRLIDEERLGVSSFIKDCGEQEGALIVAGYKNILIGSHPVSILEEFSDLTHAFIGENHKGLLIFVFNSALFEAGKEGVNLLYNLCLLSTAVTTFALFPKDYDYRHPIQEHKVDWSRWRMLSTRCCVVIRKPPLIDPVNGTLLRRDGFDEFIASWRPKQEFAKLGDLKGFIRFDSGHVLPQSYPSEFDESGELKGKDLYWDVVVRPSASEREGLKVQYFIPPLHKTAATISCQQKTSTPAIGVQSIGSRRGRPAAGGGDIEEDFIYVVKKKSPGPHFDDAQRAIYMAARGRLNLDTGEQHDRNLNAAAALRQLGFEVMPISIMLALFPRALLFASVERP